MKLIRQGSTNKQQTALASQVWRIRGQRVASNLVTNACKYRS
jgi:hypothetical protein